MLSNPTFKKALSTLLLTLFMTASLSTASAEGKRKGGPKGKPPEAAFTACANQTAEGATCNFEGPNGDTIEGSCKVPRKSEEALVCAPEGGKRHRKGGKKRD